MRIKDLKKRDYFTLKEIERPNEKQIWVKGDYDKSSKKYSCHRWGNVCSERFLDGNKEVFTSFEF